jgi:hypothetical protein
MSEYSRWDLIWCQSDAFRYLPLMSYKTGVVCSRLCTYLEYQLLPHTLYIGVIQQSGGIRRLGYYVFPLKGLSGAWIARNFVRFFQARQKKYFKKWILFFFRAHPWRHFSAEDWQTVRRAHSRRQEEGPLVLVRLQGRLSRAVPRFHHLHLPGKIWGAPFWSYSSDPPNRSPPTRAPEGPS